MARNGIEKLLIIAMNDQELQEDVVRDPQSAAEEHGIELNEAELEILKSVDRDQLETILEQMKSGVAFLSEMTSDQNEPDDVEYDGGNIVAGGIRPDTDHLDDNDTHSGE